MRLHWRIAWIVALTTVAVTGICGPDLVMRRSTIDAGGGLLSGDGYSLNATLGQADAGRLAAGDFVLQGGFWFSDAPQAAELLFKDGLE